MCGARNADALSEQLRTVSDRTGLPVRVVAHRRVSQFAPVGRAPCPRRHRVDLAALVTLGAHSTSTALRWPLVALAAALSIASLGAADLTTLGCLPGESCAASREGLRASWRIEVPITSMSAITSGPCPPGLESTCTPPTAPSIPGHLGLLTARARFAAVAAVAAVHGLTRRRVGPRSRRFTAVVADVRDMRHRRLGRLASDCRGPGAHSHDALVAADEAASSREAGGVVSQSEVAAVKVTGLPRVKAVPDWVVSRSPGSRGWSTRCCGPTSSAASPRRSTGRSARSRGSVGVHPPRRRPPTSWLRPVAGDGRADRVWGGVAGRPVPRAQMVARGRDRAARQRRAAPLVGTVVGLRLDAGHRRWSRARAELGDGIHRRHPAGASTPPRGRFARDGRAARGVRGDHPRSAGSSATGSVRVGGSRLERISASA